MAAQLFASVKALKVCEIIRTDSHLDRSDFFYLWITCFKLASAVPLRKKIAPVGNSTLPQLFSFVGLQFKYEMTTGIWIFIGNSS